MHARHNEKPVRMQTHGLPEQLPDHHAWEIERGHLEQTQQIAMHEALLKLDPFILT
jgi:hypothetical protein